MTSLRMLLVDDLGLSFWLERLLSDGETLLLRDNDFFVAEEHVDITEIEKKFEIVLITVLVVPEMNEVQAILRFLDCFGLFKVVRHACMQSNKS